jgi:hypothetical protein
MSEVSLQPRQELAQITSVSLQSIPGSAQVAAKVLKPRRHRGVGVLRGLRAAWGWSLTVVHPAAHERREFCLEARLVSSKRIGTSGQHRTAPVNEL